MNSLSILIVDDDEIFQDIFCEVLEVSGYRNVVCMSSASEALQHLVQKDQVYDCIFLDINMPGLDGIDLCQRIQRIERYRDSYVIMISSQSDRTSINDAFLAGAMDYVTKPFDPFEIRSRLRIASRLIRERQENANKNTVIDILQEKLKSHSRHEVSDRSMVEDIAGFLEYVDFENKILRCKKSTLMKSQILGMAIVDFQSLRKTTTEIGFHATITEIATKISNATELYQRALTYVGSGIFICLSDDTAIGDTSKPIHQALADIGGIEITLKDGTYLKVSLEISDPIRSGMLFPESSINLIYSAMASVSDASQLDRACIPVTDRDSVGEANSTQCQ